ncbi:hypothetical protein T08_13038 [Trichinella sp. T8]|nr:hypothetical protein T08_13038 [Trichinella sp. T8]
MEISMRVLCICFCDISCNNCWPTKMVRCGLEYRINKDGSRPGEDSYLVKLRVSSLTNDIEIYLE